MPQIRLRTMCDMHGPGYLQPSVNCCSKLHGFWGHQSLHLSVQLIVMPNLSLQRRQDHERKVLVPVKIRAPFFLLPPPLARLTSESKHGPTN